MNPAWPTTMDGLADWSKRQGVSISEARRRFVEVVVLEAIAADPVLGRVLVFKGGNALRFAHDHPRSTLDLDFSLTGEGLADREEALRAAFDEALRRTTHRHRVRARCQRVKRDPSRPEATRATYDVKVGYQLPGDRYYDSLDGRDVSSVIELEVSFNDLVCASQGFAPMGGAATLRACTIEDIIAEKLRAILQQRTRNRHRPQDVFDIAHIIRARGSGLDRKLVADFLLRKAAVRDVAVSRSAFDEELRRRAFVTYEAHVRSQAGPAFIPFEEAWSEVMALVTSLDIPG